ncbi:MAG TPA: hypothetical protein VFY16_07775 [Gemmatimonadaceae bacterium]|nr:hypothetical protein [Gemmatimonadaceae bacterium]
MTGRTVESSSRSAPPVVRIAATLLVAYGVVVVLNAALLQSAAGWAEWRDFPRALVRLGGMSLVAWGLLRGVRPAWWVAVVLGLLWFGAGVVTVGLMATGYAPLALPGASLLFVSLSLALLGAAVATLLTPGGRAPFRRT